MLKRRIDQWLKGRVVRLVLAALMLAAGFAFDATVAFALMLALMPERLLAAL